MPTKVLFEEFFLLRQRGLPTPQIAVWQNIDDPNGDLWLKFVDGVYANAS